MGWMTVALSTSNPYTSYMIKNTYITYQIEGLNELNEFNS